MFNATDMGKALLYNVKIIARKNQKEIPYFSVYNKFINKNNKIFECIRIAEHVGDMITIPYLKHFLLTYFDT